MRQIWKSRDVKWVASSIVAFQQPKPQTSPAYDDDDEDVHTWAQPHGVNIIPNDNNNTEIVAPIADVDEDEEANAEDEAEDTIEFDEDFQLPPSFSQPISKEMLCSNQHPFVLWATLKIPLPPNPGNAGDALFTA